ncbi:MAG: type II secretion system protein J, partial [Planctomycetota bacterium]
MSDTTPSRRAMRGFTLIEVLLAVAISSVVLLTVSTTFHVMLNARDVVEDLAESTEAGPRIMNLIERDLMGIWTFNVQENRVFRGRNMD